MWILCPVAAPLAKLLDRLVHGQTDPAELDEYDRAELAALVRIQYEDRIARKTVAARNKKQDVNRAKDQSWNALKKEIMERVHERDSTHNTTSNTTPANDAQEFAVEQLNPPLHRTEVDLVEGALQMKTRLVMDEYTPLRGVYALPDNLVLDREAISTIYSQGYSRVPVYCYNEANPDDHSAILGFLMTRQLMMIDWDDEREVSSLPLQRPVTVSPRMNLVDLLQLLRVGGHLMAFVCARPDLANKALETEQAIPVEAGFMGIITLEDVMESILQNRIYDEEDIRDRDRAVATLQKWAAEKLINFMKKKSKKAKEARDRAAVGSLAEKTSSVTNENTPLLQDSVTAYMNNVSDNATANQYHGGIC
jgi:metal transporter CNNM